MIDIEVPDEPKAVVRVRNGQPPVIVLPNGAEIEKQKGESDGWWLHRAQQHWMAQSWVGETDGRLMEGGSV